MDNKNIQNVGADNFEEIVMKATVPVVVDFWAPWCGPCKMLSPVLDEIANNNVDKLVIAKVNVDDEQELSARYGVQSIPTIVFFKDGEKKSQHVGMLSKKDIIEKALA